MQEERKSLIELHIAVLLFGFTAILGELIQLHPLVLTWWRVFLAAAVFLILPRIYKTIKRLSRRQILIFLGIGVIVSVHWLTFYASIKIANASITLICLATTTFFTALIEPIILKTKVSGLQLGIGLVILPGMALVVQSVNAMYLNGILLGLASAFLAATFGSLNKKHLQNHDPVSVTWIEMSGATFFLTACLPFVLRNIPIESIFPSARDWIYMIVLVLICTNLAYLLALRALRHLSAFMSALTINLEPLYGVILAAVLLHQYEELNMRFYFGALIVLSAVLIYPIISRRNKKLLINNN